MSQAAGFEVLDDGADDPALQSRIETKYCLPRADVPTLRQVLRRFGRPIRHAGPFSIVRSIYFDDDNLQACRANLDGVGVRSKTRIRWYDRPTPGDRFYLEIKWRRHQVTGKHRWRIAGGTRLAELPLARVPGELARQLPACFGALLANARQAVTVVEYRREHFAVGDARLTLDYDLRFYPLLGQRRLVLRFAERLPGLAMVECKTAVRHDEPIGGVLRALHARATRFSKYVTACQQLGYVAAEALP